MRHTLLTNQINPCDVAAEVLGVPAYTLSAERIKGGLTNESWQVSGGHEAVVVRISTADEYEMQLDRVSEARALDFVAAQGIGAPVLLNAPARHVLVTRKLPGEPLSELALHDELILQRVARLLKKLHVTPAPPQIQHINLVNVLQGYWNGLDVNGIHLYGDGRAERRRALAIAEASLQGEQAQLCHNDVHHLNIVANEQQQWLLDWEYAGHGDPLFDLASVCVYHHYGRDECEALLAAYDSTLGAESMQRLERLCWLFEYIRSLWLAVREHDVQKTTAPQS